MKKILIILLTLSNSIFCNYINGHLKSLKKSCKYAENYENQCPEYEIEPYYKKESKGRMHITTLVPSKLNPEKIKATESRKRACGEYNNKLSQYYNK